MDHTQPGGVPSDPPTELNATLPYRHDSDQRDQNGVLSPPRSPLSRSAGAIGVARRRGELAPQAELLYHDAMWENEERRRALVAEGLQLAL